MASFKIDSRVRETFLTSGTGAITTLGPAPGCRGFGFMATNDIAWYAAIKGNQSEEGIQTFTAPSTINRTVIKRNSNNDTSPVDFLPGQGEVILDVPPWVLDALNLGEITVNSAATCDIGSVQGKYVVINGTTGPITSYGTAADKERIVRHSGSTIVHDATSLILKGGVNRVTKPNDIQVLKSDASGHWREISYHPAASTAPIFSFEGDSMSYTVLNGKWPLYLGANHAFFARGTSNYYGLGGDTAQLMVGEYASQAGSVTINQGQEAYFFLLAGTNDIGINATAAATIYGYLSTIWAAARASGYKVAAFTIPPRGDFNATQNASRVELNRLILSDATLYDYLVRADEVLTDPTNAEYFQSDQLHLTTAGNVLLAKAVAAAVLGVSPVYATPFNGIPGGMQINGGFEISQKYGTTAITGISGNARVVDNVWVQTGGPVVLTAQQVADAPAGLTNSLKLTVTTADATLASTSFATVRIPLLGYRTSRLALGTNSARAIAIMFFTKHHRAGQYSGAIRNAAGDRSFRFTYQQVTADTWEPHGLIIPGDQIGTWVGNTAGVGLVLFLTMAAGSSFAQTANAWSATGEFAATGSVNGFAATSDVFQVAGLFCTPGTFLPPSMQIGQILRPRDQELLLCQQQYCSDFVYGTTPANNTQGIIKTAICYATNGIISERIRFPTKMLAIPTPTLFSSNKKISPTAGQWQFFSGGAAWTDGTSTAIAAGTTVDDMQVSLSATSTAQGAYMIAGSWEADVSLF
jgi:lysophospholipase L1-like esterase